LVLWLFKHLVPSLDLDLPSTHLKKIPCRTYPGVCGDPKLGVATPLRCVVSINRFKGINLQVSPYGSNNIYINIKEIAIFNCKIKIKITPLRISI